MKPFCIIFGVTDISCWTCTLRVLKFTICMWSHQWQNILWYDMICKSYLSSRRNIWTQVASSPHRKYYKEENGQEYLWLIDVQEQLKFACN